MTMCAYYFETFPIEANTIIAEEKLNISHDNLRNHIQSVRDFIKIMMN